MTGGTRAAALSPRAPSADWVKPLKGGEGAETGRSGFLGPPLRRGPVPQGPLTFGCVAQPRGARRARSLLRLGLSSERPQRRAPGSPSWRLPGLHRPGAARAEAVGGAGAGVPLPMGWLLSLAAGGRGLVSPRSVLSELALSLPRGGGGALGPQVGGVGLRDLQDAAHGADRPHQLLGQGRGLRHGTRRLRAAPRGGPGRG